MKTNQAVFPVHTMYRVLNVSSSRVCAWQGRALSQRAMDDAVVSEQIRLMYAGSDEIYRSPNVRTALCDQGVHVGRKPMARLTRTVGRRGVSCQRRFVVAALRDAKQRRAPDLANRKIVAQGANQL